MIRKDCMDCHGRGWKSGSEGFEPCGCDVPDYDWSPAIRMAFAVLLALGVGILIGFVLAAG